MRTRTPVSRRRKDDRVMQAQAQRHSQKPNRNAQSSAKREDSRKIRKNGGNANV